MKFKRYVFILMIVISCIILINFTYINPLIYNNNYYDDVGVKKGSHLYDDIVKKLGEPSSVEIFENSGMINYDGLQILYPINDKQKIIGAFLSVFITSEKYKFGIRKIGVGSTKKELEKAYGKLVQKIKDLPKYEIGYIDGGIWVTYYLDKNDIVYKINIASGP